MLPNQMLINILLAEVSAVNSGFKLAMISTEKKMMNLYKYEILKLERYNIKYEGE